MKQSHIHLISAGENIHVTFPKSIDEFKMDKAIVIVENKVFENDENPHYPKIRESISEVKKIASITSKSFEIKRIEKIDLENIRNVVIETFSENPDSKFYFNITGGTKVLSNGLFLMSIWLDGTAYHFGEFGEFQILSVPKIHIEDIQKNKNYISILKILTNSKNKEIKQKELFQKLGEEYKPLKNQKETNRNKDETRMELHRGTLSRWLQELEEWKLLDIIYVQGNRKEKIIKINSDGIFALRFFETIRKRSP